MTVLIPESHKDLLERPICVSFATTMPDGQPQLTSVWCDYDGTHIRIPTVRGRQKARNFMAQPKVTLLAVDPENPYRYLEVRGIVDEVSVEGAMEHLNEVTMAYMGLPNFYGAVAPVELEGKEERIICKVRPIKVNVFGQGMERKEENPELDQYHR